MLAMMYDGKLSRLAHLSSELRVVTAPPSNNFSDMTDRDVVNISDRPVVILLL
jgi:hypothetical protein